MMAGFTTTQILSVFFLAHYVLALQVSPNSPCASLCLDDPSQNPSDPNNSNTFGSDITCSDDSYSNTAAGRKFQSCVSCLQNSTASNSGETDQEWFIYNLRFALGACLFGFANATEVESTPCSTSSSCGPLQEALEDGEYITTNETAYSYCSVDNNAILGAFRSKCLTCLQGGGNELYFGNFLTALQAGCIQQPPAGTIIGLEGTVFSTVPVNITFPGYHQNGSSTSGTHKSLSQGAVIGIAVALFVLLVIAVVVLFICFRKRNGANRMKRLASPLDSRFGAKNITSPHSGAYGNPYNPPPAANFAGTELSYKELRALGRHPSILKSEISEPKEIWTDAHAQAAAQPPMYQPSSIPAHQAYITSSHTAISPVDNHNGAYPLPAYPTKTGTPSPSYVARPSPNRPPSRTSSQPTSSSYHTSPPYHNSSKYHTSPNYAPHINTNPADIPRSISRTSHRGLGNGTLTSAVDSGQSMDVPVAMSGSNISGPMIKHGGRFDFELADQERRDREARGEKLDINTNVKKKKTSWSPDSAESTEMWPGSY